MIRTFAGGLVLAGLALAPAAAGAAKPPAPEEMWRIILEQQEQIRDLTRRLEESGVLGKEGGETGLSPQAGPGTGTAPAGAAKGAAPRAPQTSRSAAPSERLEAIEQRLEETEKKVEATGAMIDKSLAEGRPEGWWDRTSLGGYGELHYNGGKKDEVDFHRFVLFVGHEFTDWARLYSELELEHALVEDTDDGSGPGEIELEQAYVEFDVTDTQHARAGLFLLSVGILNETHEPPTFFGVERNPVESNIIPTTWWEAGAGAHGELGDGFSYNLDFHSGLETPISGGSAFKIRSGRKKVAKAPAKNGAVTGRVRYTGMPGVEVGVTGQYQSDVTQGASGTGATLIEAHTDLRRGGWGLRALAARWDLNGDAPEAFGRDVQYGWYVEPSYRFPIFVGEVGVFARYNEWDNEAGSGSIDGQFTQVDVGLNYWPHPDVVFKADYQFQEAPMGESSDDRVNLGFGFQF